jgi:hypothetical protein
MRCKICNAILADSEIKFNEDHQEWDPCGVCLDEIDQVFEDLPDDEDLHVEVYYLEEEEEDLDAEDLE